MDAVPAAPAASAAPARIALEPPRRRDPVMAVFLGWLVPGLGHAAVGRPVKGLFYLALITAVFGGGLLLSHGLCVNPEREPIWFVGQAFTGAPAGVVAWLTRDVVPTERVATFDVGLLYTAVAGLLNLVAISDVLGIVDVRNRTWEAWSRSRELEPYRGGAPSATEAPDGPSPAEGAVPPPTTTETDLSNGSGAGSWDAPVAPAPPAAEGPR